jgi:Na+-transporting methylmalonyl-CoA/oxaloacetate decarboxylase gamma subunit
MNIKKITGSGGKIMGFTLPFALAGIILNVLYPLCFNTSVALLVIPGLAFVFDTWVLLLIGVVLYIISRIFRKEEDKKLENIFSKEYEIYRSKVIIPWL